MICKTRRHDILRKINIIQQPSQCGHETKIQACSHSDSVGGSRWQWLTWQSVLCIIRLSLQVLKASVKTMSLCMISTLRLSLFFKTRRYYRIGTVTIQWLTRFRCSVCELMPPSSSNTMIDAALETVTYHLAKSYLTPGDSEKITRGHSAMPAFRFIIFLPIIMFTFPS